MSNPHGPALQDGTIPFKSKKMEREFRTIKAMVGIYCRKVHHRQRSLCESCRELLNYSEKKLRLCQHFENKPSCQNCLTPCFSQSQRNLIREVMKFSGPRMMFYHPWLAVQHFLKKHFAQPCALSSGPKQFRKKVFPE